MQNYKTMPQHNIDNAVQARAISIETALILHSKLLHQPFKESYTQLSEKNSRSIATIFCLPPNLYPPPLQKLILKRRVYILSSVVINCQSCFDVTMTYNFSNFFFQLRFRVLILNTRDHNSKSQSVMQPLGVTYSVQLLYNKHTIILSICSHVMQLLS